MLIHNLPAIGIVAIVSVLIAWTVYAMITPKQSDPSPIEQQCMDEGIDIPSKCERPYSL